MFWMLTKILPGGVMARKRMIAKQTTSSQAVEHGLPNIRSRFLRPTMFPQGNTPTNNWDLQIVSHVQEHP
jgi:hypothetical protein